MKEKEKQYARIVFHTLFAKIIFVVVDALIQGRSFFYALHIPLKKKRLKLKI